MAQTKKRSTATRASSSKRSRTSKSKAPSKRSSSSRAQHAATNGSTNGVETVRNTVEDRAKSAGQTVGRAASRAKLPLVAGGAALAGAAGGLALASRHGHRSGIGSTLRKPRIQIKSDDVAKVAKEVGSFSAQVGALATELQRNREDADNGKRRSPIEVALHGLTSRR